jgi:hypothetical protein
LSQLIRNVKLLPVSDPSRARKRWPSVLTAYLGTPEVGAILDANSASGALAVNSAPVVTRIIIIDPSGPI